MVGKFRKHLIVNVNFVSVRGRIESGSMTALLGARYALLDLKLTQSSYFINLFSGCGKSTLLAALSQRLRGNFSSEIHFNGEVINRSRMTNISGFVPQSDVCFEGLTVREHFYFMVSRVIRKY